MAKVLRGDVDFSESAGKLVSHEVFCTILSFWPKSKWLRNLIDSKTLCCNGGDGRTIEELFCAGRAASFDDLARQIVM
jgi:hypothetical protein